MMKITNDHYGLLAEFKTPEAVLKAANSSRAAGYRRLDAFSPFPIAGLAEAIGFERNRISFVVLVGGLIGGISGYLLQWYSTSIHYPINVGGRPFHSWPLFIPITFEMTVLGAALAAVLGTFVLNGLPRPHHPVFSAERFERASRDRFFLCLLADDPQFEIERTRDFLQSLNPTSITTVDR